MDGRDEGHWSRLPAPTRTADRPAGTAARPRAAPMHARAGARLNAPAHRNLGACPIPSNRPAAHRLPKCARSSYHVDTLVRPRSPELLALSQIGLPGLHPCIGTTYKKRPEHRAVLPPLSARWEKRTLRSSGRRTIVRDHARQAGVRCGGRNDASQCRARQTGAEYLS